MTPAEAKLVTSLPDVKASEVSALRNKIRDGGDPLGEAFCTIRSAEVRRESGAIYTPYKIVEAMVGWAATIGAPDRIVDPGAGSGRFLIEAGRQFKRASLVAVETDPLAALLTRANIAAVGMFDRTSVLLKDFRSAEFEQIDGRTLYIGNPPYVRHHLIDGEWKRWLKEQSAELGLKASSLAGLHVYFFLAIARWAKAGDYGALISAAEWLDVNYGQLARYGIFVPAMTEPVRSVKKGLPSQSRQRCVMLLCLTFACTLKLPQYGQYGPCGQRTVSIHSRAVSSSRNMSATSRRVSPLRCALPGAFCVI